MLVGTDQRWLPLVAEAARQGETELDIVPDVPTALAGMLRPSHVYSHVLACGPLRPSEVEALAGMLDEVTLYVTPLLLLGVDWAGSNVVDRIAEPQLAPLVEALSRVAMPAVLAPLSPNELIAALHGGGLRMHFQPIVRRSDLTPIGVEALARVHTRDRGIVHPKDFIPATVASGRERVLTSIAAARTFLEMSSLVGLPELFVTINLPLVSLLHQSALRRGVELCAMAGLSPARVMVEVLESYTAPDMDVLGRALVDWRREGFVMAIDDAGPALPHWRDLMTLPFDAVKLDGTLITDPTTQPLLESIMAEAKERGLFIIAEGIEDQACLERARPLEVDALQGFLFARPLPAMALPLWLDQWRVRNGSGQEELAA